MYTVESIKTYSQESVKISSVRMVSIVDVMFSFLMIQYVVFPRAYMWLKAITLVLLMVATYLQLDGKLRFTGYSLLIAVYILFNILFTAIGTIKGFGEVAIRSATVFIIWPSTYFIFSGYRLSEDRLRKFFRLMVFFSFFICAISTVVIMSDVLHLSFVVSFLSRFRLGGYASLSGLPYFRTEHIFFFAFFTPFMLSCLMMDKAQLRKARINISFLKLITIYLFCLSILSGMGAIWIAVLSGTVLCVLRSRILKQQNVVILLTVLMAAGIMFVAVSYYRKGLVYYIFQEIGSRLYQDEISENELIRHNQIEAMINAWKESPFFGNGIGSSVRYYRGTELVEQSANEMTYFVMLYQRGLIGVGLFFMVAVFSVRSLIQRKDASWLCEPFSIGMICFLIANSFNPYLSNMSTLWILFLPFILGNNCANDENNE